MYRDATDIFFIDATASLAAQFPKYVAPTWLIPPIVKYGQVILCFSALCYGGPGVEDILRAKGCTEVSPVWAVCRGKMESKKIRGAGMG